MPVPPLVRPAVGAPSHASATGQYGLRSAPAACSVDCAPSNEDIRTGVDSASTPVVSVVMVCRDGMPYLPGALESLAAQSYPDWELVFWDNGSRDGSADVARALDGRVRVLGGPRLLSLGDARRRAIEASRGRYLAFLDADDLWRADKLDRQVARMEGGSVGLCYADCDVITGDGTVLGRYSRHSRPRWGDVRRSLVAENFIPTCTAIVSRAACRAVGGPDPRLNGAADYDLWLRMARVTRVDYDPEPIASYRVHRSSLSGDYEGIYAENRQIYERLMRGVAGSVRGPDEGALARRALASLLWKWAGRELLGPASPGAAALRTKEAWALAGGVPRALADLSTCAVRSLRGLRLRIAMNRER